MLTNRNNDNKNNDFLLKQLISILHKIIQEKKLNRPANSIKQLIHLAEKLLQIIPIDDIFNYRDQSDQNISYLFIKADFLSGFKYIEKNNIKFLYAEDKNIDYWIPAIVNNAQEIINYSLNGNSKFVVKNQLQKLIIKNDVLHIKQWLDDSRNHHLSIASYLEYAAFLDKLEIFKLFLDYNVNNLLNMQNLFLHLASTNKREMAQHLLDHLYEKNRIDDLEKYLQFTCITGLPGNWFIKCGIEKLGEKLKSDKNDLLITLLTCSLERIIYQSEEEFLDGIDSIMSILPNDPEIRRVALLTALTKAMSSSHENQQEDQWEIEINENQNTVKVLQNANTISRVTPTFHLNTLDKWFILCEKKNLVLFHDDRFSIEYWNKILVEAINKKQAMTFYYLAHAISKNKFSYLDEQGNNLAHMAAQANFNVAIGILFKLEPTLFDKKNKQGQLPLTLLSNQSPFKKIKDSQWKNYFDIKSKLVDIQFTRNNVISKSKWGNIESKYAQYLSQLRDIISLCKDKKTPLLIARSCYAEISEYLFHILTKLWSNPDCKNSEIIKLLNLYASFFTDKKIKLDDIPELYQIYFKCLVATYSRFESIEKGLETLSQNKSNAIDKNYLTLTSFSFYITKMLKNKIALPINEELRLTQDPDNYIFIASTAQILASQKQINQDSLIIDSSVVQKLDELFFIDSKREHGNNFTLYAEMCGAICYGMLLVYFFDKNNKANNSMPDFAPGLFKKLIFLLELSEKKIKKP